MGNTTPQSYDPGTLYWNDNMVYDQATCEANGGEWMGGVCVGATLTASNGNSHYHLGNYYNWTAAVAMSDSSNRSGDVNQSICPAGWMLPKSGTDVSLTGLGSFIYLKNQANLSAGPSGNIHTAPNWFAYSGYWMGRFMNAGIEGYYWSSVTDTDNDSVYRLFFDADGDFAPQYAGGRAGGNSVRCVARP